jgi:hypothetical protein
MNIAMPPIHIDVLQHILEHLDKASLAKICQLNKICCSYAQGVLYRNIQIINNENFKVCETLAQSTHLAKRVRLFGVLTFHGTIRGELLREPLQNMTNLRVLILFCSADLSVLDRCTFRLIAFHGSYYQSEHLLVPFLQNQPGLIDVTLGPTFGLCHDVTFTPTCLPNLTRIGTIFSLLPQLIPNRPVSDVTSIDLGVGGDSVDLSFFTLSTTPIWKLAINYNRLYSTPIPLIASIFPSLTYLRLDYTDLFASKETVRFINNLFNPNQMITMSVIDSH